MTINYILSYIARITIDDGSLVILLTQCYLRKMGPLIKGPSCQTWDTKTETFSVLMRETGESLYEAVLSLFPLMRLHLAHGMKLVTPENITDKLVFT